MGVSDIFSKRKKRLREEIADVFTYDAVPDALRVQIVHIWRDAFGSPDNYEGRMQHAYGNMHQTLAREYGVFALSDGSTTVEVFVNFFLRTPLYERALDAIELSFQFIEQVASDREYRFWAHPTINAAQAVEELNFRLREHGIGYQYEGGKLIRKDSELVHSEVVKPVLKLLHDKRYTGAQEEFLKAHEHYRHGRDKECLNECLKAFESTMKCISKIRGWTYSETDTAKTLIEICLQHGLVPTFFQAQFSSLRASLESGVPTVRNKLSGHGQGPKPTSVPQHLVSYLLHLTATTILLLVQSERTLP